jgi:putative ABC transport system ATP-binding protein|nr:ABC transporter ATP-binding protein [Candidatus Cryosericum odellii]
MNLIEFSEIRKVYSIGAVTIEALAGVSFEISEHEFVAIMGPSGSGKSTMMHILGFLDTPTSGTYLLKGQDVSRLRSNRLADIRNEDIGFVFQSYNLLPQLSALENVLLPCTYSAHAMNGREEKTRTLELLERVGLKDRMNNRSVEMSGGEQQRVAIARALMMDPPIILADEPTGNLNSQGAREILDIMKELHADGKTIIYVTHDDTIGAQAERVIRIQDGHIMADERN